MSRVLLFWYLPAWFMPLIYTPPFFLLPSLNWCVIDVVQNWFSKEQSFCFIQCRWTLKTEKNQGLKKCKWVRWLAHPLYMSSSVGRGLENYEDEWTKSTHIYGKGRVPDSWQSIWNSALTYFRLERERTLDDSGPQFLQQQSKASERLLGDTLTRGCTVEEWQQSRCTRVFLSVHCSK